VTGGGSMSGSLRRIAALIRKETLQVFRDPSSIAVGIVMPILLLVLFGYGLSFDVKNVPVALVMEDSSADAMGAVSGFKLSDYFAAIPVKTMVEAERLLLAKDVNAIVRIPSDFARRIELGNAEIQVVVHGTDANTARISLGYAQGAIGTWLAREAARGRARPPARRRSDQCREQALVQRDE
jgi:ABC-2 type transport system permease protein